MVITLHADISRLHFYPFCNPCSILFSFKDKIRSSPSDFFTSVLAFHIYSFALDTLTRHRRGFGLHTLSLAPFLCHTLRLSKHCAPAFPCLHFYPPLVVHPHSSKPLSSPLRVLCWQLCPTFLYFSAAEIPTTSA